MRRQEVDRDHQKALLRIHSDDDPLCVRQGSLGDAHPLSLPQVRMGQDRKVRLEEPSNGLDLPIRHDIEPVPAFAEHARQPARLADLVVTRLVHRVAQEQVATEHGDPSQPPHRTTSGPLLDRGEERVEPFRGELVVDKLFAIAVCP